MSDVGDSRGEESRVLAPLKPARVAKWPGYAKPLLGLGKLTRRAYAWFNKVPEKRIAVGEDSIWLGCMSEMENDMFVVAPAGCRVEKVFQWSHSSCRLLHKFVLRRWRTGLTGEVEVI